MDLLAEFRSVARYFSRRSASGRSHSIRAVSMEPTKSASASFVETVEFITASHSYHDNTAFGGQLFAWMDSAATISVMKHAGTKAVTASVDSLFFLKPVNIGYIVSVQAKIIATFNSSCHVRTVVMACSPKSNDRFPVAVGYFTMVALGDDGKPRRVPAIKPEGDEETRLFALASDIRHARAATKERLLRDLPR